MNPPTLALLVALAACAPLACTHVHVPYPPTAPRAERPGPPPHAPAHGYRQKHHAHGGDIELVFDSGLGVYVVVGMPGHYWHDYHYYRSVDGVWQASLSLDGGWSTAPSRKLPPGLAKKHRGPKGKSRGPHPAAHGR